jgi:hypothetical protein
MAPLRTVTAARRRMGAQRTKPKGTNMITPEGSGNAEVIIDLHQQIVNHARKSLSLAIEIGRLLTEEKKRVPRGRFGAWISLHLPSITHRTANNYMRLNRARDQIKLENVSNLAEAYNLLAGPPVMDRSEAERSSSQIRDALHNLAEIVPGLVDEFRRIRDKEEFAPDYPTFAAYLLDRNMAPDEFRAKGELCDVLKAWMSGGPANAVFKCLCLHQSSDEAVSRRKGEP